MKLSGFSLLAATSLSLAACNPGSQTTPPSTAAASAPGVPPGPADTLAPPPLDAAAAPPLTAATTAPSGEADPAGPTAPHATEQQLLQSGAYAMQYGTQLSQLALTKAPSAGLREFAEQVIKDYTRSLTYWQPAATQASVKLPASLDATPKARLAALAKLNGRAFVTDYVAQVKTNSQVLANTLAAYRQLGLTPGADLQTWIGVTLPIAENHLGMAMEVEQGKTKL